MNKCIHILVAVVVSFISSVMAQTADAPSSGDGTSGTPYQIATLNNLYWITQNNTEWGKYYIQTANIDASSTSGWDAGSGFSPIGNGSNSFTGSYNGGGYTISGLYISRSSTDYIGLFGFISDATVKNIKLTNVNFTGNSAVGGVVGFSTGSGSALIEYCSSTGTVTGSTSQIGGVIGKTQAGTTVRYCYSTVTVSSSSGNYIGGFVGHNDQSSTISNCYSRGNVSSSGNQVGGFAGVNQSATISNCYSTGSASGGSFVGGLVGAVASSTVNNSFWDADASGNSTSAAGTSKTTTQMQTQSTFTDAGWDFTNTWELIGTNYPRLQGIPDPALPVELSSFTATPNRLNAELKWSTATEVNNVGWEIHRSEVRGQSSEAGGHSERGEESSAWKKVGFVQGSGTSNSPNEYSFTDKNLNAGKYSYRLKQIDRDGKFSYSQEVEVRVGSVPKVFALEQNYPNPFNPATTINYQLPKQSRVVLKVYDILGKEVLTLVDEMKEAGSYDVKFDASRFSSGIYFAKLHASGIQLIKKMMLIR